jgi:hypothetical protein
VYISCNVLNIWLCFCHSYVSYFYLFCICGIFSNAFKCFHFFRVLIISIVSVMFPYVYPVFSVRLEFSELLLLFGNVCVYPFCLAMNIMFALCMLLGMLYLHETFRTAKYNTK